MFKSIHANVPVIAAPIAEHSRSFVSVFCFGKRNVFRLYFNEPREGFYR